MTCPGCGTQDEMAYSVISNGLICLEPGCEFEIEMDPHQAHEILALEEELVCC